MANNNFDKILDECLDRLNQGVTPEACFADYPEYAERLRPLLGAVLQTKAAYSTAPSITAKKAARQRFNTVLEGLEQRQHAKQPLFSRFFARPLTWATVAAALLIMVIGYFGLRPVLSPPSPVPNPEGNFVFLISDDVNAIADFESVNISISKIGLLSSGDSERWIEFEPEVAEVDLTLVQGDKTQEIWQGDIPEGPYTKVFIHVDDVKGILKETGQVAEVKLPSQKLQIAKPFQITADTITSFTYDLTVIATGSSQSGTKYILKPQIAQSGADSSPRPGPGKGRNR